MYGHPRAAEAALPTSRSCCDLELYIVTTMKSSVCLGLEKSCCRSVNLSSMKSLNFGSHVTPVYLMTRNKPSFVEIGSHLAALTACV